MILPLAWPGIAAGSIFTFSLTLGDYIIPQVIGDSTLYIGQVVYVRVESTDTPFTCAARIGQVLRIPIGHGEGNYFAPADVLQKLEANRQVILRYTDPSGRVDDRWNPNGSVNAIAGICSEGRNVVGMMPHTERLADPILGSDAGAGVFRSLVRWGAGVRVVAG